MPASSERLHDAGVPSITVITDMAPVSPPLDSRSHRRTPSAGLLSPGFRVQSSPHSPIFSDMSDAGSVPPSPTLSSHTATNFPTSLQLRDNQPDEHSGLTSLQLLDAGGIGSQRKASHATFNTDLDGETFRSASVILDPSADESAMNTGSTKRSKVPSEPHDKPNKDNAAALTTMTSHEREFARDESVNCTPFRFRPFQLAHLLDPKDLGSLLVLGGTDGIIRGLGTHPVHGLSTTQPHASGKPLQGAGEGASHSHNTAKRLQSPSLPDIILTEPSGKERLPSEGDDNAPYNGTIGDRKRVYGENVLPTRISKTLLQLMAAALKDRVLILLSIAAVVSLALGLFQDFGTPRNSNDPPVDWVEGVAIVVAIAIVVVVGSVNDWQKERQFKALNERKEERGVKVIRDGVEKVIDIKEVVVGDIALVEPGEIVPCDGIFISGHNVKCDESGATGESDAIKKHSCSEVVELIGSGHAGSHTDCFMISGSKVIEGVGKYVVVAVGTKSFNGRIMMALRTDTENTPLQIKLNILAELIAKAGAISGLALFVALMIEFFVQLGMHHSSQTPSEWGIQFVNILIIAVTLVVVAVPEGLPLAVTLALAFATKRMTYENLLVRVLGSCETMANASVICTDKTGTLTQNAMTVVAGSVGIHAKFVRSLDENSARTNADETERSSSGSEVKRRHPYDFSIDQAHLNDVLSTELQELFNEAIAVNSTAFEDEDPKTGKKIFVGSKTETALLQFAEELNWRNARETRDAADIVQLIPFSSERKAMGVVIKKPHGGYRAYFKGASEILAKKSSKHIVVNKDGNYSGGIETKDIDELSRENISRTIIFYANQMLRTIALGYRDYDSWPPEGTILDDAEKVPFDDLATDLTLICITGIEDPLREGVRDAVLDCRRAGVSIKMCTGDNALTARSIATQCGIFTPGGIIMEGPVFRQLSQADMMEIVPRLQILARSSPEDKKILVETLKMTGEIVGVTGDGANDGPALKTADVGFSMGIAGTEIAKEASDIILMDDNFASIVKAIMWGRCVNDAVRKFLQFQISTNVTAVIITFVSSLAGTSVLSAVQLLWINIIMDTFAALALATDPASQELLDRKPDKKTAPLFTVEMYRMILLQSVYQITVILIFHFLGVKILGLENDTQNDAIVKTLVFNAFVFAQIFNSLNCRRLDSKLNIFEGILRNRYFLAITLIEIAVQILIVFIGGAAFQVTRIGAREWGISLALGFVSIPWGAVIRLLPTKPFARLFRAIRLLPEEEVLPVVKPDREGWGGAISMVRDNLNTFSHIRGGRLRSSSFVLKSRQARLPQDDQLRISSILAMAPTLMIGAVVAGTQYLQAGSRSDPANTDPSRSSAALWEGKLQIHPDTDMDDPVYKRFAGKENIA